MVYFVTKARLLAPSNSYRLMLACDVIIIIYSLIYLICGFLTLSRRIPRKVVSVRPFVQVGVILAMIQLIMSAINGIHVDHLIILGACAIVIPEAFFLLLGLLMSRK